MGSQAVPVQEGLGVGGWLVETTEAGRTLRRWGRELLGG